MSNIEIKDEIEVKSTLGWDRITNKPTTLSGYGITDKVAMDGHKHHISEIIQGSNTEDYIKIQANGGNADTLAGRSVGYGPGQIPYIGEDGKLPESIISANTLDGKRVYVRTNAPINAPDGSILFDTTNMLIKVKKGSDWEAFGAAFK